MVFAMTATTSSGRTWRPWLGRTQTLVGACSIRRPARAMDGPDIQVGHIDLDAMQLLLPSNAYDFYVCGPRP